MLGYDVISECDVRGLGEPGADGESEEVDVADLAWGHVDLALVVDGLDRGRARIITTVVE